jgi:hypothetical protein
MNPLPRSPFRDGGGTALMGCASIGQLSCASLRFR